MCARCIGRFQKQLRSFADHPLVGEVRGVGLIGALELVADKAHEGSLRPRRPRSASRRSMRAQEHGVIVRAIGDAVAFCPPLIITEREIDEMFRRWDPVLDQTLSWVKDQGLKAA